MQVAHPLVAEGVEQHSTFRTDPWARLEGTLRSYLRIVYGTPAASAAEIRRLNRLHRAVTGPVRDAEARSRFAATYQARDPALALWVHATLVDSTLAAYEAWLEPLGDARRAAFYLETRPVGQAFGIPDGLLPADYPAFRDYVDGMLGPDGPVHPTPTSRSIAADIVRPPLGALGRDRRVARGLAGPRLGRVLDIVPTAATGWPLWPGIALLPDSLRLELGIDWSAGHRVIAAWLATGYRAWRPLLPPSLRWMPQARAADVRAARALAAHARIADAWRQSAAELAD